MSNILLIHRTIFYVINYATYKKGNKNEQFSSTKNREKNVLLQKFLDFVEIGGNKLPHPVTLFAMLCVGVAIISAIAAGMGLSVEADILNRATNEIETTVVSAVSLLNGEGFKYMLEMQ